MDPAEHLLYAVRELRDVMVVKAGGDPCVAAICNLHSHLGGRGRPCYRDAIEEKLLLLRVKPFSQLAQERKWNQEFVSKASTLTFGEGWVPTLYGSQRAGLQGMCASLPLASTWTR